MSDAEHEEIEREGSAPEEDSDPEPSNEPAEAEPTPLEAMTAERDKLKDQLLRTAADFDNFRKRTRKDLEQAERRGKEDVLREVLPVIDNLERAIAASQGTSDVGSIREGVEMVLRLFEDAASRIGVERVKAVGERFDPALHDAIQQLETDEHAPGTIMAEITPGYRLGEKLIRPGMVVVARKPTPTEEA